jgi:hypothetical protein
VYNPASGYDTRIRNFLKRVRSDASKKLVALGVDQAVAAAITDEGSPQSSSLLLGGVPSAIRGKARTVAKGLGKRLNDFASAAEEFQKLATKLEDRWEKGDKVNEWIPARPRTSERFTPPHTPLIWQPMDAIKDPSGPRDLSWNR